MKIISKLINKEEPYVIGEDTLVEGDIESGAKIELKKGATLHVQGSILESVAITGVEQKPAFRVNVPGGSFYISGGVRTKPGGAISVTDSKTGKTSSITEIATEAPESSLNVEGSIGRNTRIRLSGKVIVQGNLAGYVSIQAKSITVGKPGTPGTLEEHCHLLSDDEVFCGSTGHNATITSKYKSITANGIGALSTLKAGKNITVQDIEDGSTIKADHEVVCGNVGQGVTVQSKYRSIRAKNIEESAELRANASINTESVGQLSKLEADQDITCTSIGKVTTITSKYGNIITSTLAEGCTLKAGKTITASDVAKGCTLNADNDIYCSSVGISSIVRSKYKSIVVSGHVASRARLEGAKDVQVMSYEQDTFFKTPTQIDLSKKNLQMKAPVSSAPQNHSDEPPPYVGSISLEADQNANIVLSKTIDSASIVINGGAQPTEVKSINVSSIAKQSDASKNPAASSAEIRPDAKVLNRHNFLAAYEKRQKAKPVVEDNSNQLKPFK